MENGEWKMENGKWKMENGELSVECWVKTNIPIYQYTNIPITNIPITK
jgi:hypothetical protein